MMANDIAKSFSFVTELLYYYNNDLWELWKEYHYFDVIGWESFSKVKSESFKFNPNFFKGLKSSLEVSYPYSLHVLKYLTVE